MKPRRPEVRVSLETALWMSTSAALLAAIIAGAVFPPSTIQCPEERQPAAECRMKTAVYAFHFFEHLTGAQVIDLVKDLQRAMAVGATLNVVVPFYNSNIAHQDLDHKTFFTEETWRTLFRNPFYDKNREDPWKFIIGTNVIIGVAERNLAVMSQLIRVA